MTGMTLLLYCLGTGIDTALALSLTEFCTVRASRNFCFITAAGQPLHCAISAQRLHNITALTLSSLLHFIHDKQSIQCLALPVGTTRRAWRPLGRLCQRVAWMPGGSLSSSLVH